MTQADATRSNQKRRTRRELLRAATRLMQQGRKPTLEEVAEEALVSRATAYRYFGNVDALLVEAPLDLALPEPADLFGQSAPADPVARLDRLAATMDAMLAVNETPLRLMLAKSLERSITDGGDDDVPPRQNRRTHLIEAALAPAGTAFPPEDLARLTAALALVFGIEAQIVFRDVLQMPDADAQDVRRWMIRALVDAART
ncbi:TetR/AcrR family transcriptional regulator [Hyphomonas johnsonii]|uniref:TetR family transcriptional regulator n=1 Tax=Hyphomonas johnsonii MHS-2 TaxID=1280950 RepID=A0A059FPK1_9PROT|nr:TetR/AcrR family transcriptional regulator [Hyphomonas johnsonii]KCZ92456.1 TetR family transcriptional regulator [Hyphomonas johnsonii MHS-2]